MYLEIVEDLRVEPAPALSTILFYSVGATPYCCSTQISFPSETIKFQDLGLGRVGQWTMHIGQSRALEVIRYGLPEFTPDTQFVLVSCHCLVLGFSTKCFTTIPKLSDKRRLLARHRLRLDLTQEFLCQIIWAILLIGFFSWQF